jgi:hypothetical protein
VNSGKGVKKDGPFVNLASNYRMGLLTYFLTTKGKQVIFLKIFLFKKSL